MDKKTKDFLNDNFKAGEYSRLTILINNKDLEAFVEYLKKANMNLAMLPEVAMDLELAKDDDGMDN